jgi:hypothetical protein
MYRVLLKIEKVSLKIVEEVELHILIRKEHKFFTFCRNEPLKNGEAVLTHNAEFLIDAKSPRFDIEIFLVSGQTRKRGGVVPVNLKAFTINASHKAVEPIRKTPLTQSSLAIELVYMRSEYRLEEGLISVERLEEMILSSRIKGVIDEHEKLIFRNNLLNNEVEELRERNTVLLQQQQSLQTTLTEKETRFHQEIILIEKTKQESLNCQEKDKQWMAEMIEDIEQEINAEEGSGAARRRHSPPKK